MLALVQWCRNHWTHPWLRKLCNATHMPPSTLLLFGKLDHLVHPPAAVLHNQQSTCAGGFHSTLSSTANKVVPRLKPALRAGCHGCVCHSWTPWLCVIAGCHGCHGCVCHSLDARAVLHFVPAPVFLHFLACRQCLPSSYTSDCWTVRRKGGACRHAARPGGAAPGLTAGRLRRGRHWGGGGGPLGSHFAWHLGCLGRG